MTAPATVVSVSHDGSTWTTVTDYVAGNTGGGVSFSRGRSRLLADWEPGSIAVAFRNRARVLDPSNYSATHRLRPGDYIKVTCGGVAAFYGIIEDVEATYRKASGTPSVDSLLMVRGTDLLGKYAKSNVYDDGGADFVLAVDDWVTAAIADIDPTMSPTVDASTVLAASPSSLPGGTVPLTNLTGAVGTAMTSWQFLQALTRTEGGASRMYTTKAGVFTWRKRGHRPSQVVAFGGSGIDFHDFRTDMTSDEWANSVSVVPVEHDDVQTSSTSRSIGTGSKSFTLDAPTLAFAFSAGASVTIESDTSGDRMVGTVTSIDTATYALVAEITSTEGSGTYSAWTMLFAEPATPQTATDATAQAAEGQRHRSVSTLHPTLPLAATEAVIRAAEAYPSRRVSSIRVALHALDSTDQGTVLGLEIGDAASVYLDLGTGDPQAIAQTRFIDGIAHDIPGNGEHWVDLALGMEPTFTCTPVLRQNSADIAATVRDASYTITSDGWVLAHIMLEAAANSTGGGTACGITSTDLPNPLASYDGDHCGTFVYNDAGTRYVGVAVWDGTTIVFYAHGENNFVGVDPSFAVATGDTLSVSLRYRYI